MEIRRKKGGAEWALELEEMIKPYLKMIENGRKPIDVINEVKILIALSILLFLTFLFFFKF